MSPSQITQTSSTDLYRSESDFTHFQAYPRNPPKNSFQIHQIVGPRPSLSNQGVDCPSLYLLNKISREAAAYFNFDLCRLQFSKERRVFWRRMPFLPEGTLMELLGRVQTCSNGIFGFRRMVSKDGVFNFSPGNGFRVR